MTGKSSLLILIAVCGVATAWLLVQQSEHRTIRSTDERADPTPAQGLIREPIPEPPREPPKPLPPVGLYFLHTSGRPIPRARAFFFDRAGSIVAERVSRADGGIDVQGVPAHAEVRIAKSGFGVTVAAPGQKEIRTWAMRCIDIVVTNTPASIARRYELWVGQPSAVTLGGARWIPGSVPLENGRGRIYSDEGVRLIGRDRRTGMFVPFEIKPNWRNGLWFDLSRMAK